MLIYRIPLNLSIKFPSSYCPSCDTSLKFFENIPILSFLFLRGKCAHCSVKISSRYIFVESIVGLISIPIIYKLIYLNFLELGNLEPNSLFLNILNFIFLICIISVFVALAFIDVAFRQLPHGLTYSCIIIAIIYSAIFKTPGLTLSITNLGIVFFIFDALTHFANKIYYKEKALAIAPSAICFRHNFLQKNITWVYLIWLSLFAYLIYVQNYETLSSVFLLLGVSYILNDIFLDFFFLKREEREELYVPQHKIEKVNTVNNRQTVMGGGDAAMAAAIACLLDLYLALTAILASFYIALAILLAGKIYSFTKNQLSSVEDKRHRAKDSQDKFIPLGLSLAIAAIAAIILKI